MLSTLYSISSLFLSFSLLCLGHGLLNTLIGVRAVLENYSDLTIGLIASAYFLGFIVGVHFCGRLISNVGHIRTFAAITSLTSVIAIAYILVVSPVTWIIFRFAYGICIASLYMVLESWLNLLSTPSNRGKVLSIYMVLNYSNIALAQLFFKFANPGTFVLFLIVSILISISLVPLSISKKVKQVDIKFEQLSFAKILRISPTASIGCVASGLITGTIWGLCATFLVQINFTVDKVALLIGMTFVGGLFLQWPIGALSDLIDRRYVISGCCFVGGIVTMLMLLFLNDLSIYYQAILFATMGGSIYPLYSLSIALINDYLETKYLIKASGSLLQLHAVGAIAGPLLAAAMMEWLGVNGFLVYLTSMLFLTALITILTTFFYRITNLAKEKYIAVPRTSIGVFDLDPRVHDANPDTKKP